MILNFDKLFKYCVVFMKINRSHPNIHKDTKWLLQIGPIQGLYTISFLFIAHSALVYDIKNDISKCCENGTVAVFYIVVTFQYCMIIRHQDRLKRLITTMESDYTSALNLPSEERKIVLNHAKKGQWVIKLWMLLVVNIGGLFFSKSIALMVYYSIVDKFKPILIIDVTFPGALDDLKNSVGLFAVIYAIMLFYLLYTCCAYLGIVPLGPIFMLHACGQMELVKGGLMKLFPNYGYSPTKCRKEVKAIAVQLENVYK